MARLAAAVLFGATGCFVDFGELRDPPGDGCPSEVAGAWRFDEAAGQQAQSATSCHAVTLGHSDAAEASDPSWAADARACSGAALAFDGVDDRATVNVRIAPSMVFDFCLLPEPVQTNTYPRVVSTEEALFDGFYVNINVLNATDLTLEARLPGTARAAETEIATGVLVGGTRTCWRVAYEDTGDRMIRVFEAAGASYQEVGSYLKQNPLNGELHVNDVSMVIGNQPDGTRPLAGVLDEVRLFSGAADAAPPACDPP